MTKFYKKLFNKISNIHKKHKKKIFIFLISFAGLILIFYLQFTKINEMHIEDIDPETTRLNVITEKDLLSNNFGYVIYRKNLSYNSSKSFSLYKYGNNTGRGNNASEVIFSSKKFSGVYALQKSKLNEGQNLKIYYSSEVKSGNFEIIIVSPKNEIIIRKAGNDEGTIEINDTIPGLYTVIAGGESVNCEITLKRDIIN